MRYGHRPTRVYVFVVLVRGKGLLSHVCAASGAARVLQALGCCA